MVQLSAEARLWWPQGQGSAVAQWFGGLSDVQPGGAARRTDIYVRDMGPELGIKLRAAGSAAARMEVKSLVAMRADAAPVGPVSIWTKVAAPADLIAHAPAITLDKQRWLRKYGWAGGALAEIALDADEKPAGAWPDAGCNVEWTRVERAGSDGIWHTLGYEAFGTLDEVEPILRACIRHTLACAPLPAVGQPGSYPEWLQYPGA